MCSSVPKANFRLEPDAAVLQNALLHLTEQLQHVCGGRAAAVDNKARVFFRDLRAADRQALQPALVDQRPFSPADSMSAAA